MATPAANPHLAQEFIRLLHNENSALQQRVTELERAAAASSSTKPPAYDDLNVIEALRKQCQELLSERDALRVQVASAKSAPCTVVAHMQATANVEHIAKKLAETILAKDRLEETHRKRILQLEAAYHALEEEKAQLQQQLARASVERTSIANDFDINAFLEELRGRDVNKPKLYKGPFLKSSSLRLPKGASELMPWGSVRYSQAEIIWKSPGAPQFVALGPMHMFNHNVNKSEGGKWERAVTQQEIAEGQNRKRDVFFLWNHAWHYYGTYECVGYVALSAAQVEEISSAQLVAYVQKRTLLDSERAPPHTSKQIQTMYSQGILKIECLAFRRAGFNEALNALLEEQKGETKPQNAHTSVPGKRARDNEPKRKQLQQSGQAKAPKRST